MALDQRGGFEPGSRARRSARTACPRRSAPTGVRRVSPWFSTSSRSTPSLSAMAPRRSPEVPGASGPPFGTISSPSGLGQGVVHVLMVFHSPPKSYSVPSSRRDLVRCRSTSMAVSCTSSLTSCADGVVGAVGLVGLHHGEFRGVRGVDALVAEVAVDFEHAVDAADQAALAEQFAGAMRRYRSKVEGGHARGERAGRRARRAGSAASGSRPRGSRGRRRSGAGRPRPWSGCAPCCGCSRPRSCRCTACGCGCL